MANMYLISTLSLFLFLGVGWFITGILHLTGTAEMMVRTVLITLSFGIYGWVMVSMNQRRLKKEQAAAQGGPAIATGPPTGADIDYLVRQAETHLASARLGKDAKLSALPVVFVLGEGGSAKTSTFVHSGIEPDLIAGQVLQDNAVVATRPANFWLARRWVFVEAGGRLLNSQHEWLHLIKKMQPSSFKSAFKRRTTAVRTAVVCVDAETFMRPGADEALTATARNLNARLGEISHTLGIQFPFYVLFTKLDRLSFFPEFFSTLSDEEVNQIFGVTLPVRNGSQNGVYAEQEARRLTGGFNELFYRLCDKRPVYLGREHDEEILPKIYEFPREFRKLRNSLVRFLVELGRPSQVRANPMLRGFYFSGVRPIVVNEGSPAVKSADVGQQRLRQAATILFDADAIVPQQAIQDRGARTRRIPQWLFLGHLFGNLLPTDRAIGASAVNARGEFLRRALLIGGSALLGLWCLGMTVSFFGNRALESKVENAASQISRYETGGAAQQLPSIDSLHRLDTLRQSVQLLSLYRREGAPLGLRWGLYIGNRIYPSVRRLYFNRFYQLLFGATQTSLLEWMRKLPDQPGANDDYTYTYNTLKAYLITTNHPEKSTRDFLTPVLMDRWAAGREVDYERRELARNQFDFYADELPLGNPFSSDTEGETVEHARAYLARFNAIESVYQFMLAEANRQKPPVNFNKQFSGSSAYVVNNKDVAGAFTAEGWKFMQDAIHHVKRYFGGERWVLGENNYSNLDPDKVIPDLQARYEKDFIGNWRQYLANSSVVPYASISDAAHKLGQLSSNQSFLMALFCVATTNTINSSDTAKAPLQPVHYVEPSGCMDRFSNEHNNSYLTALGTLQSSMARVASSSVPDDATVGQTLTDATNALGVTRNIAQNFTIDHGATPGVHEMVQKLMEDPIRYAQGLLARLGPAQLNSQGRHFCEDFSGLAHKYPFQTSSHIDATLVEIDGFFRPGDGRLSTFYDQVLKNYVDKVGGRYVARSDSHVQVTAGFLSFLNRAQALSDALYRGDSKSPKLVYSMTALPAEGLQSVTLTLDGQVLHASGKGGVTHEFTWPGTTQQAARLSGSLGGPELGFISYDGLWAAFRFFGDADRFQENGNTYILEWVPRQGVSAQPIRLPNGKTLTLPFSLDLKGAPPIFKKGYLAGLQCVSQVAR